MNMAKEITAHLTRKTATDWFYERIADLKTRMPKNYKMELLALLPEEYDTAGGGQIINNVLACRSTDMAVLKAIELLISDQTTQESF